MLTPVIPLYLQPATHPAGARLLGLRVAQPGPYSGVLDADGLQRIMPTSPARRRWPRASACGGGEAGAAVLPCAAASCAERVTPADTAASCAWPGAAT
ncbi:MAG: hypothetical protein IPH51_22920 [Rubrivivax sp.]|nr:hypothetical protein [Rubrivivax sp.]